MVHHLENGYVCNFISHILPDTEMPLDRKTGSWTRPRHSAAAGRSSTDPEANPQSTWAAFWSCFWWAIPLTLPKHFRLWNRLCGGRWSRAVTWSISRAGAGRVVLRLCPTGSSCTGPCSDRRWTELKLNHYFLSWELSVSVPQWLLPEPSCLPVLLPVPAMVTAAGVGGRPCRGPGARARQALLLCRPSRASLISAVDAALAWCLSSGTEMLQLLSGKALAPKIFS